MSCPYFIPTEVLGGEHFIHRARLPLGDGYTGRCCARGGECPSEDELRRFCNVGYAAAYRDKCPHLPAERDWDAVRLGATGNGDGVVAVTYVCERDYLPVTHGLLEYDRAMSRWKSPHEDERIQSKAEMYLRNWIVAHPLPRR